MPLSVPRNRNVTGSRCSATTRAATRSAATAWVSKSVFGLSDPLTVTASGAEGTKAGSIAYSVPFTRWGTRAGFQYDASAIEIKSGPFEPLDVTGNASNLGFNVTQPVIAENQQRVNVFAGYNTKDSITKFSEVPLTRADTRTFTLGFDAQRFTANGFWYTRQFLTRGSSNWGGDLDFIKYNADGLWTNTYSNGLTSIVRGSFQLANEPRLPSFEQFFIGGMATVRGYPEGLLIGARGYFVSGELQMPMLSTQRTASGAPIGDRLRGVLFFDHGGVVPGGVTGQSFDWGDTLTSTGGGFVYSFTKYFSGRVMLGLPLAERGPAPRDWVLHVYVQSMVY
jgi:hemolysin activation/secretion protein